MSLELGKKDCFWDISIEIFELENILNCRRGRLFCNYAKNWHNEEIRWTEKKKKTMLKTFYTIMKSMSFVWL